ncbi:MAG: hypothetical protein RMK00_09205, partial [Bacteroidota bacterium]|nr:hypothetical protein [Bacteroidota bacterium]
MKGVQYALHNVTGGVNLTHTSPSQYTIISGATTAGSAGSQYIVADEDGDIVVEITDLTVFSTPGTITFRWDAFTQSVPTSCNEQGVTSNLTVLGAPGNAAIQQTAVFLDNTNTPSAPGGTYNFYICRGNNVATTNTFTLSGGAGATQYAWCVGHYTSHRNPTITLLGITTATLDLTIDDPNDTPYRDTLYLRVRLTNASGCAIEYQAALFVVPENDIAQGVSNGGTSPTSNPTTFCVGPGGTIISPSTHTFDESNFHAAPPYAAPWPGGDAPASITGSYSWSAAVNSLTPDGTLGPAITPGNVASGNTITFAATPVNNPTLVDITMTESYTGCSRNTSYQIEVYPQPTATVTASPNPVCEN